MRPTGASLNQKSRLDKALSVFGTVRKGEGLTALLLAANVFLLLTAYYIIKPVREPLILGGVGAEVKRWVRQLWLLQTGILRSLCRRRARFHSVRTSRE